MLMNNLVNGNVFKPWRKNRTCFLSYSCVVLSFCWLISSNRTFSLIQNIILIAIDKLSSSLSSSSGLRTQLLDLMKSSASLKACLWQSILCSVWEKKFYYWICFLRMMCHMLTKHYWHDTQHQLLQLNRTCIY